MKVNRIRQNVLPLIAAFIWGTAFVAQSMSTDYVGPFTFNAARSVIAFIFLFVLCAVLRGTKKKQGVYQPSGKKDLIIGGLFCGTALAVASNLQQKGIETTTSGKAGFITALYIVLVPIVGIFLNRKVGKLVWIGVFLALAGLYCLCITEEFTVATGDFYLLACAVCFTVQIMAVDHFVQKVDGVALSCAQFLVVTVISTVGMLMTETPSAEGVMHCLLPILYVGVFSSGIAYTLQIMAQKDSNPTVVTLLLSLESVFATLAGAVILHDRMSGREYFGCALMLLAVILAQLPEKKASKGERTMVRPIMKDQLFLAQKSVTATAEDLDIARDLLETLQANAAGCVGMAANMIGVNKRIIAFDHEGTYMVMFNPEIIRQEGPYSAEEGCLSLPGKRTAKRYRSIKVKYQNEAFQVRMKTFTGWTAQIIQHEIDHCNGILI